jgi:amino acid transporter
LAAAVLAFNGIVGAGIFVLPGLVFTEFGAFGPWMFPIFGLLMLVIVAPMAAVSSRFDITGGPVAYVTQAFGPFPGFQAGWLNYLAKLTSMAANVTVLAAYAAGLFPTLENGVARAAIIMVVLGALTLVNYVGVQRAVAVLNVASLFKVAPLILFAVAGLWMFGPALSMPTALPAFSTVETSALIILYAFVGFEHVMVSAGETVDPKRSVPRAMVGTVAFSALFYFLIQLAYTAVAPDGTDEAPLIAFGVAIAGGAGAVVMTLTAIASLTGNLQGNMLTSPRITFAMAEQRTLPRWLGRVHPRFSTPSSSILLYGALALALALSGSFVFLAVLGTLARLFLYGLVFASLPKLRRDAGERALPSLAMMVALVAGSAILLWAMVQSKPDAWWMLGGAVLAGTGLFVVARRGAASARVDR